MGTMVRGECIAVTGGAGFIGSHVVQRLLAAGAAEVRVVDDLSSGDYANLDAVVEDPRLKFFQADIRDTDAMKVIGGVDRLLHLAATKHSPSKGNATALIETNINGTYNVISAAIEGGAKQIVFASSLYVYGTDELGPYSEDSPLLARTLYGATKIAGERLVRSMTSAAGIEGTCLRYFFVYGPRLYQKNYANSLVPRTIRRLSDGVAPEIYGDGSQTFDYIYVDDAVAATVKALECSVTDGVVNIGSGAGVSVLEVAERLRETLGSELEPVFADADETAGTVRTGVVTRQNSELGLRTEISLTEGLRRSVEWWRWRQSAGGRTVEPTF